MKNNKKNKELTSMKQFQRPTDGNLLDRRTYKPKKSYI